MQNATQCKSDSSTDKISERIALQCTAIERDEARPHFHRATYKQETSRQRTRLLQLRNKCTRLVTKTTVKQNSPSLLTRDCCCSSRFLHPCMFAAEPAETELSTQDSDDAFKMSKPANTEVAFFEMRAGAARKLVQLRKSNSSIITQLMLL